jgi:glycosyltransferase involved in cell wall biosynthesis
MRRKNMTRSILEDAPVAVAPVPGRGGVALVSHTPFHMFDQGKALRRRGWDVSLFTATPRWRVDPEVAEPIHIKLGWATWHQGLRRLARFGVYLPGDLSWWMTRRSRSEFAAWVPRHLDGIRILDALSSWGLELGATIHRQGGHYVCNRGSAHILSQKTILEEELPRWSLPKPGGFPDWIVERELAEYALADAIIVPSRFALRTFLEHGVPADKLHVCPYGVDLSSFSRQPRQDDRFRVLFVGSVSIRKGIGYLLEAVRPLVQRNLLELWVVGAVAKEARGLLARSRDLFIHKGFVPPARLAATYSQGSTLVLPSVEDGFGRVQVEAMACGVPVIASTNTGVADLLTDGQEGFIVPIRDSRSIRERLEWMLAHPAERDRMGEAALRRVTSIGGWEAYGAAVERTYLELLDRQAS